MTCGHFGNLASTWTLLVVAVFVLNTKVAAQVNIRVVSKTERLQHQKNETKSYITGEDLVLSTTTNVIRNDKLYLSASSVLPQSNTESVKTNVSEYLTSYFDFGISSHTILLSNGNLLGIVPPPGQPKIEFILFNKWELVPSKSADATKLIREMRQRRGPQQVSDFEEAAKTQTATPQIKLYELSKDLKEWRVANLEGTVEVLVLEAGSDMMISRVNGRRDVNLELIDVDSDLRIDFIRFESNAKGNPNWLAIDRGGLKLLTSSQYQNIKDRGEDEFLEIERNQRLDHRGQKHR